MRRTHRPLPIQLKNHHNQQTFLSDLLAQARGFDADKRLVCEKAFGWFCLLRRFHIGTPVRVSGLRNSFVSAHCKESWHTPKCFAPVRMGF